MLKWFKRLQHIIDFYDADRFALEQKLHERIKYLEDLLVEQTKIGINIGHKSSYVIVMGEYKRHNLVEIFTMSSNDFTSIVHDLKELEKRGNVQFIDAPLGVRTVLKRGVED